MTTSTETPEKPKTIEVARAAVQPAAEVAEAIGVPAERLTHARDVVESLQQNGVALGALDASGTATPAHVAASLSDRALLYAIYEQAGQAAIIVEDSDGLTPAHYVALRCVTETEAGRCAEMLSSLGVAFTIPNAPGQTAPIDAIGSEWPTWKEQWIMFRKQNAQLDSRAQSSKLETALALLRSRARRRSALRLLKSLG